MHLLRTHFCTPILDCEKPTEQNRVGDQTWESFQRIVSFAPKYGSLRMHSRHFPIRRQFHLPAINQGPNPIVSAKSEEVCTTMCTTAEYAVKEVIKIYKLNNKEAEAKMQEAGSAQVWSLTPLSFCKRSLWIQTIGTIKSSKPLAVDFGQTEK